MSTVKSEELREIAAKRRQVQVPGASEPPPPAPPAPPEILRPADAAPIGPQSREYWADKPWREAEAWWLSQPPEQRRSFTAYCADGTYCAPYVDPRMHPGFRQSV